MKKKDDDVLVKWLGQGNRATSSARVLKSVLKQPFFSTRGISTSEQRSVNSLIKHQVLTRCVVPIVKNLTNSSKWIIMIGTKISSESNMNHYLLSDYLYGEKFYDDYEKTIIRRGLSKEDLDNIKGRLSIRNVYALTGLDFSLVMEVIVVGDKPSQCVSDFSVYVLRSVPWVRTTRSAFVAHSSVEEHFVSSKANQKEGIEQEKASDEDECADESANGP